MAHVHRMEEEIWSVFSSSPLNSCRHNLSPGPLFYINIAGQNAVVIGSHQVAADLLDRRAAIYSDRARNIVAGELLTGGLVFAFAQHNDIWKRMRRGSHEYV
jgi:hypothetical protein